MSGRDLTQAVADALLAMEKHRVDGGLWHYPKGRGAIQVPLVADDGRERFLLDLSRAGIHLAKATYQNRARTAVVLARLDVGGPPHRNPDGARVGSPHLHLYREGLGDKWATCVPAAHFPSIGDLRGTLTGFMRFCNITKPPDIR